jgi:site-specific DNA-methyltransferase (adenine-specific)
MNYFIVGNDYSWDLLVWNKTNPFPTNQTWLSDVEYCLYFREKGFNVGADDYEYKSKWFVSSINQKDKAEYDHPTIKPLELVKRHLQNVTKEGDIVLDCFIGSGTTAVAAKELGRKYIGFEINPEYYKIAVDRLNGITARDRERKEQGQLDLFDFL